MCDEEHCLDYELEYEPEFEEEFYEMTDADVDRAMHHLEGEHMQALQKAFSKVTPVSWRRVRPGRFSLDQPLGKCWISRSWSVMKMTRFLPAAGLEDPAAEAVLLSAPPSARVGAAIAAFFKISLRVIILPPISVRLPCQSRDDPRLTSLPT